MRRGRGALLAALAAAVAAGCGGAEGGRAALGDPGLVLDVGVSPTPATVGAARVLVSLTDTAGAPVPGARIVVRGRSPGGPDAAAVEGGPGEAGVPAQEAAPGRYVVPDLALPVSGSWVLEVRADLPDGRWAARERPLLVTGAPASR